MRNKMKLTIILITMLFMGACNGNKSQLETTQETSCNKNSECWCRSFNGSEFYEGKEPSKCIEGKCAWCIYD